MKYSEEPNIDYVKDIANGDIAFETQLIDIIRNELPFEIKEFQQNFDSKHYLRAAENVHKLKHKINIFGLSKGYIVATDFEKELKKSSFSNYIIFKEILLTIENYVKTL